MSSQLSMLGLGAPPAPSAPTLPPREDALSPCLLYRYWLRIPLAAAGPTLLWVMFNPSTATKETNDATIESLLRISRAWQPDEIAFGAVEVVNLFAYRATSPAELQREFGRNGAIVGRDNDRYIAQASDRAARCIVAWGSLVKASPVYQARAKAVLAMLREHWDELFCVGLNQGGIPRHPLYLPGNTAPQIFDLP